jgi:hypothetical protein
MKNFSLTWFLSDYPDTKAGVVREVSKDILVEYLEKIKGNSGSLELTLEGNYISAITVEFENNKYTIYYRYEKDAEWHVCSFIANKIDDSIDEFRGDDWNSYLIFDNFNLAKEMFLEFLQNEGRTPSWVMNKV